MNLLSHAAPRFRLTLLLVFAGLLAGCVAVEDRLPYYYPSRTVLAAERVELPVTFAGIYPFIEVRINGEGPFYLLLDSGCHHLVLLPRTAKRAHLKPGRVSKNRIAVNGGTGFVEQSVAQVNLLEAGGLSLENVNALVADVESNTAEIVTQATGLKAGNFDGALGLSALHDVIFEIDYPNNKVAVVRRGAGQYPREREVACNFADGIGRATLEIAGKKIPVAIDTGSGAWFETVTWEGVPLLFPQQKVDGALYGMGGHDARVEWGQLSEAIHLGPITWENAVMTSTHAKESFIGAKALTPWKVVFDQQANLIYFLGNDTSIGWPKKTEPNPQYKLGYYCEVHGEGIRLLEVDAGGAFDRAGLRVGDIITSVAGHSPVDWIYERVPTEIRKQPRLKLKATRDGAAFEPIVVQGQD